MALVNFPGIQISTTVKQKAGTKIQFEAPIILESNANFQCSPKIGAFTHIVSGKIKGLKLIGRYCSVANDVKIGETNHPTHWLSTSSFQYNPSRFSWHDPDLAKLAEPFVAENKKLTKAGALIGHDVWVGAGAQIQRGVQIGHGAIVAAGAVVIRDVMPFEIVGGVPAKHIRFRFPEKIIARLLETAWWQYHPLDLRDVNFSDITAALDQIEILRSNNKISPWDGEWHQLREGKVTPIDELQG